MKNKLDLNSWDETWGKVIGSSGISEKKLIKQVDELIKAGADVNATNPYQQGNTTALKIKNASALMTAIDNGYLESAEKLIKAGADVNARDRIGNTPLMIAANHGALNCTEKLIAAGADVNAKRSKDGLTALFFVSAGYAFYNPQRYTKCIEKLIAAGADVNAENKDGETPLMMAAGTPKRTEVLKKLVELGAVVNVKAANGHTPLMEAVLFGDPEYIKILAEAGANVNAKNENQDGATALMFATRKGKTEAIEKLVEFGADINAKDNNGSTALMYADGNINAIKKLIELGADVDAKNNFGKTALDYAINYYYADKYTVTQIFENADHIRANYLKNHQETTENKDIQTLKEKSIRAEKREELRSIRKKIKSLEEKELSLKEQLRSSTPERNKKAKELLIARMNARKKMESR